MKVGGRGEGKVPQNPPIVWFMTNDPEATCKPAPTYKAVGAKSINHMSNMLFSHLSVREAALASSGCTHWSEINFPYLALIVDSGIDVGPLADALVKRGRTAGVLFVMRVEHG